jgi:apoptotic chromatin condensation inducer in the nucleus
LHGVQGVEWPQANRSKLSLQFIPVDIAEAAIANEQVPPPLLRTSLSGGRLASSSSLPRQGSKLGAAADKAIAAAATDSAAAKEGSPAAAAAAGAAGKPNIMDRLRFSDGAGDGEGPGAEAAADAAAPARARLAPAEEEVVTLDDLFRKTKAKPHLYYLPLTDEQVAEKKERREARAAAGSGGRGAGREPVGPAVQEGIVS